MGTYTGGLCEINEGLIINCQVSSVGEAGTDYVGGIAGLNKNGGRMENCSFTDRTVTGRNYVGGFAAENYGVIENPWLGKDDGSGERTVLGGVVRSYGSEAYGYAGGVAGRNYGSGSIYLAGGRGLLTAVTSNGSHAGGVAGYNEGRIAVIPSSDGNGVVSINGSVAGYRNVGGVAGYNAANTQTTGFHGYILSLIHILLRLLAGNSKIDYPATFGMEEASYNKLQRMLKSPNGIIYLTGPTGSGKTTTLYMILEEISKRPVNISTIEDPVEKNLPKVNQMQVNNQAGLTFEIGLRALLRQDPDVIMVGETRDGETVSYTHLDVYKRQPFCHSRLFLQYTRLYNPKELW